MGISEIIDSAEKFIELVIKGMKSSFSGLLAGVIVEAFVDAIPDFWTRLLINLILTIAFALSLSSMKYWGTAYMIGWLSVLFYLSVSAPDILALLTPLLVLL